MLVPAGAHYHFGCLFDLKAENQAATDWSDLLKQIRAWITRKYPDNQPLRGRWFFSGGEWRLLGTPRVWVKTEVAQRAGPDGFPHYWALRYEHPCEDIASRQWRTDIGVTALSSVRYRFSLTTTHWLLPGYIGQEPEAPQPTAPGIVPALLGSPRWTAWAGSERLRTEPEAVNVGEGERLRSRLEDPLRQCALVVIARERDSDLLKINPTHLARLLAGNACVLAATSTEVDRELEYILPRGFRWSNGMVRVFQPGVRFDREADARRHRFFRREDIDSLTAEVVEGMIVRGVARRSRTWAVDGVGSIEDTLAKQREIRLQDLRQSASDASLEQRVKLQDDLIEAVDEENRSLSGQIDVLKKELEEVGADRAELESSISTLEYERDYHKGAALEAEQRARQLSDQRAILSHLRKLPETVPEIIEVIERIWADRIVFTERAKVSAQKASINKARSEISQVWECLWAMATDLHDILFQSESNKGNIPQEFRARTGFELTFTEGKQTKQDKKFMRLRQDLFRGREVDITAHVKYGNTPPRCLRVHFCPLHEEKIIVVGHCGDHLDTYGTQRLP